MFRNPLKRKLFTSKGKSWYNNFCIQCISFVYNQTYFKMTVNLCNEGHQWIKYLAWHACSTLYLGHMGALYPFRINLCNQTLTWIKIKWKCVCAFQRLRFANSPVVNFSSGCFFCFILFFKEKHFFGSLKGFIFVKLHVFIRTISIVCHLYNYINNIERGPELNNYVVTDDTIMR